MIDEGLPDWTPVAFLFSVMSQRWSPPRLFRAM
jgi:hypothetical protein